MLGWPCNVTLPSPFRPPLWVTPTALTGQLLSSRLWSFLVKLTLLLSWFISVGHTSKQTWWCKPLQVFVSSLSSDPACCQWAGLADPVAVLTRENTICPHIGSQRKTSPVWDARPACAADPMRDKIYMKKVFKGKPRYSWCRWLRAICNWSHLEFFAKRQNFSPFFPPWLKLSCLPRSRFLGSLLHHASTNVRRLLGCL